jgi:hypothetical protein
MQSDQAALRATSLRLTHSDFVRLSAVPLSRGAQTFYVRFNKGIGQLLGRVQPTSTDTTPAGFNDARALAQRNDLIRPAPAGTVVGGLGNCQVFEACNVLRDSVTGRVPTIYAIPEGALLIGGWRGRWSWPVCCHVVDACTIASTCEDGSVISNARSMASRIIVITRVGSWSRLASVAIDV